MKTKSHFRQLLVMMLMLIASILPAWAWDHVETFTDDGNENCTFKWNDGDTSPYWVKGGTKGKRRDVNVTDIRAFRTVTKLNNANGIYKWEWHFRVVPHTVVSNSSNDTWNSNINGTIYFILDNGDVKKFCDFDKTAGNTHWNWYTGYGTPNMEFDSGSGYILCNYMPSSSYVSRIRKIRIYVEKTVHSDRSWGPYEYEKDVNQNFTPLPQPEFAWTDDGRIEVKSENAYDGLSQEKCENQSYEIKYSFYFNGFRSRGPWWFTFSNGTVYSRKENKIGHDYISAHDYLNDGDIVPFTTPVRFSSKSNIKAHEYLYGNEKKVTKTWVTNRDDRILQPYTHPKDVITDFDQWSKKATITWKPTLKVSLSNSGSKSDSVDCRTDGTWYVLRYPKEADLDHRVYTLVGSLRGNAANLKLTDPEELEYSNSYVYRVIFLPELLGNKYKDKISEMPYSSLYAEKDLKAELNVPIVLSQDRTDDTGIKIVWQYSIGKGGCVFRLERRPSGSKAWTEVKTMNADTGLHELSYVDRDNTAITSACDFYDYRIVTTVNGVEIVSDPLSLCSLPQGTYISRVSASTGTEEKNVIVKWNVVQRGSDDTYFQILRRPIGTEEWTLLTDEIHGTEQEYTYIDDRAMAGTYYEYSVRAYGTRCEGQVVQSDDKIAPGFSQARGTITGHIAFGSGTSVSDVRVNLVKSSADEETDTPQFLSRRISGEGNGLTWTADSAKYAPILNGKSPFSLQLWARPAVSASSSKMSLLYLNNTLEIGIKRISDNSNYSIQSRNFYDSEGRFVIASASDWEDFAAIVNSGQTTLNAVMMSDVDLGNSQTMVGANVDNPYMGKFDGNGYSLTINYYMDSPVANDGDHMVAPFCHVGGEGTIQNIHIIGKISTNAKFAGGIIGATISGSTVSLYRCRSSVAIEARAAGDGSHGGLVGLSGSKSLTINNSLFDGSISGNGLTSCGGFIGWVQGDRTANLSYCLMNPASVTVTDNCATFARARDNNDLQFDHCYYTQAMGDAQGNAVSPSDLTASTMGSSLSWTTNSEGEVVPLWLIQPLDLKSVTHYMSLPTSPAIHEASAGTSDDLFCLYAVDVSSGDLNTYQVTEFRNLTFDEDDFTHIAARYTGSKWIFTVGNDTLRQDSITVRSTDWNVISNPNTISLSIGGSRNLTGSTFDGYVDDVRLWKHALSQREVTNNFSRILGGTELDLMLYWNFDEGISIKRYAFDSSCQDGIFNLNNPEVGVNALPDEVVPKNLNLYGMTDAEGDYIIRGIPFQQGGTNYKVVPELGIHEFNPNSQSMFVSPTSLTANNVDFEDVSSFPMKGHVYFAGTNIPVEGMQFYVDGKLATGNGEVISSDADGHYLISVPIGKHYVQAKLGNHTMVNGGRFPSGTGLYDFTQSVVYDFADSTLVNFVGRIGGGEVNDTLAVGFGASKNNIGIATLQLKINNDGFSFNCADDHISDAATVRTFESDTTSINSKAWSGVGTESKFIYIRTDSLTGEFSAKLPPLKYITRSITIDKNPKIDFVSLPEVDLTNVQMVSRDSLIQISEQGDSTINYYSYNTKLIRTYFSTPKIELRQTKFNYDTDVAEGAFGIHNWYDFEDDFGTINIENIWQVVADTIQYRFGYPIYRTLDSVRMEVFGYEQYVNYDSGTPVTEKLPMKGQILTISNEMSADQVVVADTSVSELGLMPGDVFNLKSNELILGADGRNEFKWIVGLPNITAPYTRNLNISYVRNGRSRLWDNPLQAVVLGSLDMGSNFVTQGPDVVTMVLRDPPGATSKTTWKTGHTETKVSTTAHGFYGDEKITGSISVGTIAKVEKGTMFFMTEACELKSTVDYGDGFHYKVNRYNQTDETWTMTSSEAISTNTGKTYVGADGDVFIGASTNLVFGETRKLHFFRNSATDPFVLDLRNARSVGTKIKTSFRYSTYEIEKVMIPKWQETIRQLMTFVKTEEEARNYDNTTEQSVYLSWLDKDDPNLGQENTYIHKCPKTGNNHNDTIQVCMSQIQSWKDILAANERDKILAIDGSDYFKENISFDGGMGYTYSLRNDTTYQKKHTYSHNFGFVLNISHFDEEDLEFGYSKVDVGLETENGWSMTTVDSDFDDNTKDWAELEYAMSDGNKGTDFSVNIYQSPSGWSDIFSILGGQSYNPYEGKRVTKYYEPGKHVLENGTQQMEQPDIQISTDGNIAGESATLIDVPAGQTGQFTLHLSNNGITTQGFDFSFNIMVQEKANQQGLQILMDGVPANGRSILIPAGETVKKVITVKQTDPSVLDYKDIELRLTSQYQAVKIYDAVTLNVHFKPSSTPIDLVITEPVLNLSTGTNLKAKATNFDRTFKGLSKVGLQYRYENGPTWVTPYSYFVSRKDSTDAGDKPLPSDTDLLMEVDMGDDSYYPQGTYTFRAFTMTKYDDEPIYAYSDLVTVIKDNVSPRAITTPTPSNGILGYGEDLSIEFTEDIVPGYVTDKNVIVTARLNDRDIDHAVSYHLESMAPKCRTRNPIFLTGDFSVEFWLKWTNGGTILQQGMGHNKLALTLDNEGHAHVKLANADYQSRKTLPKGEWTYMVLSYNSVDKNFSMLAQYGDSTISLFDEQQVVIEYSQMIRYADDNYLYMNSDTMMGDIHDLCLFNIYRKVRDAASTKYQAKDNYVYGLVNYWPMNEGHGTVISDTRHTHDFDVNNLWTLSYENQSVTLNGGKGMSFNLTGHSTSIGDSYAIEMWIEPRDVDSIATIFETGTVASNHLHLYLNSQLQLWLQYGDKEQMVADIYDDGIEGNFNNWYHIALNVKRGQAASFYLNGQRTCVINEGDLPRIEGASFKLGEGFKGSFDEIRYWTASLSENRLLSNLYNTVDTTEIYSLGLAAYFPFDMLEEIDQQWKRNFTLKNMAKGATDEMSILSDYSGTLNAAPLKLMAPETKLIASPVASNRKIVINLSTNTVEPRDIEGTTLNILVNKIHDLNGNESQAISWTAYVQQNTLKWMKDSVSIIKNYGDAATFDVKIVNKGGTTEYYTIHNLPEWLTLVDSESAEDVPPLSEKILRFKVNPLVAIGNYDITIGLQGNLEIIEPLRLVMKVTGERPDWSVNPRDYEHQMAFIGQIRIGGILMENPESLLAAFIGDKCRGVASPNKVRDVAYISLNVYGNDADAGQPISFRIWDASTGLTYTDAILTLNNGTKLEQSFVKDEFVGSYDYPVIWSKSNLMEQRVSTYQNWNWIGLGVQPANTAPSDVFNTYKGWALNIKDKDSSIAYYNGTQWGGTLQVNANVMYKLKISPIPNSPVMPAYFNVKGEQVVLEETPVFLVPGWNWIAYTPFVTMTVNEALAGANAKYGDKVKSQYGFATYGSSGWDGNLKALEPGHGYMYYSVDTESKQFVYPVTTSSHAPLRARAMDVPSLFTPVDNHQYPDNMTMVVQLVDGTNQVDTAEVAVFVDNECRAAARAIGGLYYLLIAGEGAEQPMSIYSNIDDVTLLLDNSQFYVSDDNIGDPWNPYVIDLQNLRVGISGVNSDAEADEEWYTLQGFKLGRRPIEPGIYIHNGKKESVK